MNLFLFINPADASDRRNYPFRRHRANGEIPLISGAGNLGNHWEQRRKFFPIGTAQKMTRREEATFA